MASAEAVRVSSRGIRFISGGYSAVAFGSVQHRTGLVHIESGTGSTWVSSQCRTSRRAMCELWGDGVGTGYSSVVFPNAGHPARVTVNIGGVNATSGSALMGMSAGELQSIVRSTVRGELSPFLLAVHANRCPEGQTGRQFVIQNPLNGTIRSPIDVSLCNVVGAGGDFVFMPHRGVVYAMMSPISFQVFVAISGLTIFLVVTLAMNLEASLGKQEMKVRSWPTIVAMVGLLFLTFFANGSRDVLGPYITIEDRFAFVVTTSYVGYYVLRMASWTGMSTPINPVIGTLVLVAMRVYSTMDNPYSTVGAFLLGTRLLHKVALLEPGVARSMDVLVDSVLISIIIYAGMVPQYDRDPVVMGLFLLQGAFAATTLNRVLIGLHGEDGRKVKQS